MDSNIYVDSQQSPGCVRDWRESTRMCPKISSIQYLRFLSHTKIYEFCILYRDDTFLQRSFHKNSPVSHLIAFTLDLHLF
jgi:hypothetical protein